MPHPYNLRSARRVKNAKKTSGTPAAPPEPFDEKKYHLLLQEIFPSKYTDMKVEEDNDSDYTTEDEEEEDEMSDSEEDEEDEDDDDDDDSDSSYEDEGQTINIVLSMDGEEGKSSKFSSAEQKYLKSLDEPARLSTLAKLEEVTLHIGESTKPPRFALVEADIPIEFKACALKKYNAVRASKDGDSAKYSQWLSLFREIPFGKYCHLPVTMADGQEKCQAFMAEAKRHLDNSTYGLDDAKLQLMQYIGQLIANPNAAGTSIAIQGPMGTGKTTLIKEGLGNILQRPCVLIALGGNNDGSTFKGHSITYEASIPGKIATSLMKSRCMNPIFFFDELDKVSETAKGDEIIGILTHLTDSTQNTKFHDEYFADIDFDLSKALFVFSYNDAAKIKRLHPILRDRMYEVQTKGYSPAEKAVIAKKYLLKGIRDNVKFEEGEVTFSDEAISFIIDHHTDQEQGVRNLKRCLETILAKLNLFRLMAVTDISLKVTFPYVVTAETVRVLLKQDLPPTYSHMYC